MKRGLVLTALCMLATLIGGLSLRCRRNVRPEESSRIERPPRIRPDYTEAWIPPNIAPLNFIVEEAGTHFRVEIHSTRGKPIVVDSQSASIAIPLKPWRALLESNRGETLRWEIYARGTAGDWRRFEPIRNTIAREEIDRYLSYRKIGPVYNFWMDIALRQRDLSSYAETDILRSTQFRFYPTPDNPCINCHSYRSNRTDRMTIGFRSKVNGSCTPLAVDGSVTRLNTKFGYTAWHPSGRLVAYSLNKVRQFFHHSREEVRDVIDLDSDLATYEVGASEVKTTAAIAAPDRLETYPTWSPDGRFLYFCSAPILWTDQEQIPPERFREVKYDLLRISYDVERGTWGELETVLSSDATGLSILLPRVSPDGKSLLFCMCQYGCFPIYQPSSDLYLLDLESGQYRRLEINSDQSESWHCWSSNGRWFVFSSKRRDGLFTRTYLSNFDESGVVHKPLILPQRDPTFYDSHLKTFSVPELTTEPVRVSARQVAGAIRSSRRIEVTMPDISMTRQPGPAPADPPWRPGTFERE